MGPLAQLHELSKNTEERLASLNALSEHVTHKAKALTNLAVGAGRQGEAVRSLQLFARAREMFEPARTVPATRVAFVSRSEAVSIWTRARSSAGTLDGWSA